MHLGFKIKRIVFAFLFLHVTLHAISEHSVLEKFKEGKYESVCKEGMALFYTGHEEEFFVTMVASACAKSDNLNPLGLLQAKLVNSESARESAVMFSALIMQKRILYHYMIDGMDLSEYSFAYSSHILSLIFSHLKSGEFTLMSEDPKMLKFSEGNREVFVSVSDDEVKKILVDEYEDSRLIMRHWYQ